MLLVWLDTKLLVLKNPSEELMYCQASSFRQYSVWLRTGRPSDRGSIPRRIFPLTSVSRSALGPTQPPVQWVPGDPFPEGKARPGRDTDRSPPSNAEIKNE
jgi:hypothetical protein